MTEVVRHRFSLDWSDAALVSLFAIVLVGATQLALTADLEAPSLPTGGATPVDAAVIVAVIVVQSILLALLWRGYSWLPSWARTGVKYVAFGAFLGLLAALVTPEGLALLGAIWAVLYGLGKLDLYWIVHNSIAVLISILAAGLIGYALDPVVVVTLLALLALWDEIAVNLSGLMLSIVDASASLGIPNYVVIPESWRFDLEVVREALDGERDGVPGLLIGAGDFVIPTALPVAAALAANDGGSVLPAVGAGLGILLVIPVLTPGEEDEEARPGLPYLNSGAIAGYLVGVGGALLLATGGVLI